MIILLSASNSFSWPIPDTGQADCFDNNTQIDCPEPGNDFYGQDAQYIINSPSYTKLDPTGTPLPENATSWAMIQDNNTDLIWEVQTNDHSIHDNNKTYEWNDIQDALIDYLNENVYGGMTNWRLPGILELISIIHLNYKPVMDPMFNGISNIYWSSVPLSNTDGIWGVNFSNGIVNYSPENMQQSVRAVCQKINEIPDNWIVNTNTIIDKRTGLMWQRETMPSALSWKNALAHCESLSLDNYSDWRLPNIKELLSIVDFVGNNPSIFSKFDTMSSFYWSSTTYTQKVETAWGVVFDYGSATSKEKKLLHYTRAVRGGQQHLVNHIYIQSPRQADIWKEGNTIPIIWDTSNISGDVQIFISDNFGISFTPIVQQTTNDGQYNWSAPFPLPPSSNCFLKIQPIDAPDKGNSIGLFQIEGTSVSIEGYLTDANDMPITNTMFSINGKRIQTDQVGGYECKLTAFQSGTYDLLFWVNNYQAKLFEDISLRLDETNVLNVQIPNIFALEGYIANFWGEAINDATVTVQDKKEQTDDKGFYQLDKLDIGTATIHISHPDYYALTRTVEIVPGKCVSLNAELMQKGLILNFVTTTLPEAIVDQSYESSVKANGTMPLTYSLVSGHFPQGLTIHSQTGIISGAVSSEGSYTFTLGIYDASDLYAEREFTMDAFQQLTLTTQHINGISVQENYSLYLLAKGGRQPYSFEMISGALPEGISLSKAGIISGTPLTISDKTNITIQVTDSRGKMAHRDYDIQVYDPLMLPSEKIVNGVVGQSLAIELSVTGGNGIYNWNIEPELIPNGLTLNNAESTITGTLTQAIHKILTLFVTDSEGRHAFCNLNLNIVSELEIITTALPNALQNKPYEESIPVKGGIAPYTYTCTGLSPDLTYNPQTGIISGSSAVIGYHNILIRVSDSSQPTPQIVTKTMGLRTTSSLSIQTNGVLPKAIHGEDIEIITMNAGGGKLPYTWSCDALPEGIYLNPIKGILSGTPLTFGHKQFKISVQDAQNQVSEKEFVWHIIQEMQLMTYDLKDAYANIYYRETIDVIGGIPPYYFKLESGTFPTGLRLHEHGLIYGNPTSLSMPQRFTIEVMDSCTPPQTMKRTYQINTIKELSLDPSVIPDTKVGHGYHTIIKAMLGTPPYHWKTDNLPHGLSYTVNQDSITIEGTAQEPGSFTWGVEITDSSSPVHTAVYAYTIDIYDHLKIQNAWLTEASTYVYYTDTIQVDGGKPPYIWRIVDNYLPKGLSLNPQTGAIYGTIKDSNISNVVFTAEVEDSFIQPTTNRQILTFDVKNDLHIVTETITDATQYQNVTSSIVGGGGILPYQWQIRSGKLPHCVSFNELTGRLQGRPNTAGTFLLEITLIDDRGEKVWYNYNWTVRPVEIVGDINNDRQRDLIDLIIALQYISNIKKDKTGFFDINNNCSLELTEVLYLINQIFIDVEK